MQNNKHYCIPFLLLVFLGENVYEKSMQEKKCYKNLDIPDHQIVVFNLLCKAPKGPYYRCEATLIFHSY